MFWIPMAAGAAMGMLGNKKKQAAAKKQNKYNAEVIRYSPWTGMQGPGVAQAPDMLGDVLKGASMGGMLGQMGGAGGPAAGAVGSANPTWSGMMAGGGDKYLEDEALGQLSGSAGSFGAGSGPYVRS